MRIHWESTLRGRMLQRFRGVALAGFALTCKVIGAKEASASSAQDLRG
jgi:hypothetical protein